MKEDEFRLLIKRTIQYNKIVKLEDKVNQKLFSEAEERSVRFSIQNGDKLELVPLSELIEKFKDLKCSKDEMDSLKNESKDIDDYIERKIGGEKEKQAILDQDVPEFLKQDPLDVADGVMPDDLEGQA